MNDQMTFDIASSPHPVQLGFRSIFFIVLSMSWR